MGRPTDYTLEKAALLCSRIADGNSLRSVCEMDDMPTTQTHYTWMSKHPEYLEQYARAKTDSADSDADRVENIAEKTLRGEYDPQSARVAIDAYKWTAGKKRPKKYGERVAVDMSKKELSDMDEEELDRLILERQRAAQQSAED